MANVKNKLNKINKYFDLPEGLITGGVHIELMSNKQAILDGKCSILQYSDTQIKINTGNGTVEFLGKNLCLDTLNKEGALISGTIEKIEFA
ncbi:MAG: YabP/YqfC family sporulation protein [Clostridia bacterium]|nr:YabP/YqfC family sporulation protein [Clostridia bacterium]